MTASYDSPVAGEHAGEHASERADQERELLDYLDQLISAAVEERIATTSIRRLAPEEPPPPEVLEVSPAQEIADAVRPKPEVAQRKISKSSRKATEVCRASMSEQLMALFRNTEQSSTEERPPQGCDTAIKPGRRPAVASRDRRSGSTLPADNLAKEVRATASSSGLLEAKPSIFLRHYLDHYPDPVETPRDPIPSGLALLDSHLAGGFRPGLNLISGQVHAGKTVFMQSMVWGTVLSQRPLLYYALREGAMGSWMRLVAALGHIIGSAAISLGRLRAGKLSSEEYETLTNLDRVLQTSVLPCLYLVDTPSLRLDTLGSLIDDVRVRAGGVADRHGRNPAIFIDDLDCLPPFASGLPMAHLLSSLDHAMIADQFPCLATMTLPLGYGGRGVDLPVQTFLIMKARPASPGDHFLRVDLNLCKNSLKGWTGTLPLLLDHRSGLFTALTLAEKDRSI